MQADLQLKSLVFARQCQQVFHRIMMLSSIFGIESEFEQFSREMIHFGLFGTMSMFAFEKQGALIPYRGLKLYFEIESILKDCDDINGKALTGAFVDDCIGLETIIRDTVEVVTSQERSEFHFDPDLIAQLKAEIEKERSDQKQARGKNEEATVDRLGIENLSRSHRRIYQARPLESRLDSERRAQWKPHQVRDRTEDPFTNWRNQTAQAQSFTKDAFIPSLRIQRDTDDLPAVKVGNLAEGVTYEDAFTPSLRVQRDTDDVPAVKVGNLAEGVTYEDVKALFKPLGTVRSVFVPETQRGSLPRHGYVKFQFEEDVENAISSLDGMEFSGLTLSVKRAESRVARNTQG
eukprot:TRINITY_DN11629_c0_g2_i3.p1 TRINITY_DN11629_c0_g2~~TRINITY_DN11629_c0_g2_i3.p1  ORF type:complete len:406 (-),score=71.05 TRINITY_DN11629_c0_g2_i3:105-1148(-)